jgi:hypothetical protein
MRACDEYVMNHPARLLRRDSATGKALTTLCTLDTQAIEAAEQPADEVVAGWLETMPGSVVVDRG